ncbi:MAG: hypothetical protein IJC97_00290 [Oscillospiraceae bacterium]|nr:hypothetical protein [Oscillospiraceae bacterium]
MNFPVGSRKRNSDEKPSDFSLCQGYQMKEENFLTKSGPLRRFPSSGY